MEEFTKSLEQKENQENGKITRPNLLALFLILSMVNGVLSSISNLMIYGMVDAFREVFAEQDVMKVMGVEIDLSLFLNTDKNFFLFQGVLYLLSFSGALLMWNYKKIGFHFYTLSQILLLIVVKVYLPDLPFPLLDFITTAFFVMVYAKNLSLMRK